MGFFLPCSHMFYPMSLYLAGFTFAPELRKVRGAAQTLSGSCAEFTTPQLGQQFPNVRPSQLSKSRTPPLMTPFSLALVKPADKADFTLCDI